LDFPLEYHAEVLQKTTPEEIGAKRMLAFVIAAAITIFVLFQAAFRSWRLGLLVLLTLPVALLGGVLGALINGAQLSLGAAIGFLALFAIGARNGALVISHLQHLRRDEREAFGPALVERGARERLAPVLTTAAASALTALPFVILGSRPGLEVVSPMAVVILGGLVTSTFLALFLLPALYLRFGAGAQPELVPDEDLLYRWAYAEPEPAPATLPAGVTLVPADEGDGAPHRQPLAGTPAEEDEAAGAILVPTDAGEGAPEPEPLTTTSTGEVDLPPRAVVDDDESERGEREPAV
jgi:hypothetical protein